MFNVGMFLQGASAIMTPINILLIIGGVALGIAFGAIPGLTSGICISLCLPLTYTLNIYSSFALLIGVFLGGISGGLISAILVNVPGTPSSVATCFDGHPMVLKGQAQKALGTGVVFSFLGTLFSVLLLMFMTPWLSNLALKFAAYEYFALNMFSLTLIGVLSGKNLWKGLLGGLFGMFIAMVGISPVDQLRRFTFGIPALAGGFNRLPAMIGMFVFAEVIKAAMDTSESNMEIHQAPMMKGFGFTMKEFIAQWKNFLIAAATGSFVGILPGIGAATSNLVSYSLVQRTSKHPEKFGTGIMDGIVASEASNNAVVGSAFIPLLSLGIPGDANTALLLSALMVAGLTPGPSLIKTNGQFVYAIFVALLVASVAMLVIEFFGIPLFVKLLKIPRYILMPIVFMMVAVGAWSTSGRLYDMITLVFFGIFGYIMQRNGVPRSPIVLGYVLEIGAETYLRQALQWSHGDLTVFLQRPISCVFLAATFICVIWMAIDYYKKRAAERKQNIFIAEAPEDD